ncbi:MAG: hypothetical protein JSW39_18325 [Desulfobacterales bacterium]|nr:MAG: hypothetical protein JSW39_18325 [Desulfobacterales bacterium]
MEKITGYRLEALKALCNRIALEYPEAIGMALIELNCGCIKACGVSAKGDPIGPLQTISSRGNDSYAPVCFKCRQDEGKFMERVVQRGLMWPGAAGERPDRSLRVSIGRKVFGAGFIELE